MRRIGAERDDREVARILRPCRRLITLCEALKNRPLIRPVRENTVTPSPAKPHALAAINRPFGEISADSPTPRVR
jgi:hypothetical protein